MEIEREVLVLKTRLLGAEHEETVISATNLAVSLSRCGQNTVCEQLLRDTLVLSRRALGPTHERAQPLLQVLRELGLAVQWATGSAGSAPLATCHMAGISQVPRAAQQQGRTPEGGPVKKPVWARCSAT